MLLRLCRSQQRGGKEPTMKSLECVACLLRGMGWGNWAQWGLGMKPAFPCKFGGGDISVVLMPIEDQAELGIHCWLTPYVQLKQDTD